MTKSEYEMVILEELNPCEPPVCDECGCTAKMTGDSDIPTVHAETGETLFNTYWTEWECPQCGGCFCIPIHRWTYQRRRAE